MHRFAINIAAWVILAAATLAPGAASAAPDCGQYSNSVAMSWPSENPVWEFCYVRARDSTPPFDGSGLEIYDLTYNGHLVWQRGNVPIVNVEYGPGGCGCFRDWMDSEVRFEAVGSPCSGGYCETTQPPLTICDCAPTNQCDTNPNNSCNTDVGTFNGVAAEKLADRLILTTHTSAGWYRYAMKWSFHLDGTIEPQFSFAATPNGCTDESHFHHGYYRLDFDIDGADNDQVFSVLPGADSGGDDDGDADGVADSIDNCSTLANANQRDTNGDGFGNACDPDLDNDGVVSFSDLGLLKSDFFAVTDGDSDLNGDGVVNFVDLGILKQFFFGAPGPAGVPDLESQYLVEATGFSSPNQSWLVKDMNSGRGYRLIPGPDDHALTADTFNPIPFARGDFWALAQRATEVVDPGTSCAANLTAYQDGESLDGEDLVLWYRVGALHVGLDECFCGKQGPRFVPTGDWSP